MCINDMTNSTFIIILGFTLIFTALTNIPTESHEDRRHLSQDTYTAIGKLLTCDDASATSVNGIHIRDALGCNSTGGIAVSANPGIADNSLRTLTRERFMNHNSSTESLNYTALGESLTCNDINPTSEHGSSLMKVLGCDNVNNENSTTVP
jgi:hypothetical protein